MDITSSLKHKVGMVSHQSFESLCKEVFDYQKNNNVVYADFCSHFDHYPIFLPISAFKNHKVISGHDAEKFYFESSGTSSTINSRHYVKDLEFYLSNATRIFTQEYGYLGDYCILALLPHYLERKNSSLIAMVDHFIHLSQHEYSGFYLDNKAELYEKLIVCKEKGIKTILFGVSFALMDFAENFSIDFPELIVMETGGMKGRRAEITKEEMHHILAKSFGSNKIHSEYGMTELLSQAYSKVDGLFTCGASMKIIVTEINDPMSVAPYGKAGIINIIDLANIDSCAFIATEDIGIVYEDGTFKILGRLDQSDIRGCNLLLSDL